MEHLSKQKTVSVVITTQNRPKAFCECLWSVTRQSLIPDEIIIIDDASECDYVESCDAYQFCFSKGIQTIFIKNEKKLGGAKSRNRGAQEASTDVLMFLDDDDTWEPNKISDQMAVFNSSDETGLVYTGRLIVDSRNRSDILYTIPAHCEGDLFPQILKNNIIGVTSGVAILKSIFINVGGFDPDLPARQDYDLWIRICQVTKVSTDKKFNLRYTINITSGLQISSRKLGHQKAIFHLIKKYESFVLSQSKNFQKAVLSERYFYLSKHLKKHSFFDSLYWGVKSFYKKPQLRTLALLLPEKLTRNLRR